MIHFAELLEANPLFEKAVQEKLERDKLLLSEAIAFFRDKRKLGKQSEKEWNLEIELAEYLTQNFTT